ncbi:MAG: hypothetical protein OJF51_004409 [Nitrospira sp.]|jgi:hypothetical protein|nr:MAG: hypothetical protein OJF51_004409 [Nitrospira sp.]
MRADILRSFGKGGHASVGSAEVNKGARRIAMGLHKGFCVDSWEIYVLFIARQTDHGGK